MGRRFQNLPRPPDGRGTRFSGGYAKYVLVLSLKRACPVLFACVRVCVCVKPKTKKEGEKTPQQNKYRVSAILTKIGFRFSGWHIEESQRITLSYKTFRMIMMLDEEHEPIITYERTAKEKYQLLKDLGFMNDTGVLNIPQIKNFLDVE